MTPSQIDAQAARDKKFYNELINRDREALKAKELRQIIKSRSIAIGKVSDFITLCEERAQAYASRATTTATVDPTHPGKRLDAAAAKLLADYAEGIAKAANDCSFATLKSLAVEIAEYSRNTRAAASPNPAAARMAELNRQVRILS